LAVVEINHLDMRENCQFRSLPYCYSGSSFDVTTSDLFGTRAIPFSRFGPSSCCWGCVSVAILLRAEPGIHGPLQISPGGRLYEAIRQLSFDAHRVAFGELVLALRNRNSPEGVAVCRVLVSDRNRLSLSEVTMASRAAHRAAGQYSQMRMRPTNMGGYPFKIGFPNAAPGDRVSAFFRHQALSGLLQDSVAGQSQLEALGLGCLPADHHRRTEVNASARRVTTAPAGTFRPSIV